MRPIHRKTPHKTPRKSGPKTKPKPNLINRDNNKDKEPVEVFCRLRPLNDYTDLVAVQRVSDTLISLCPNNATKAHFYKFKHIFDQNVSQKQLFNNIALPLVNDLINGKNGLLFTYGITCSGKTHTIIGSSEDNGILPRTLDVIFNSLNENNLQTHKYVFKPNGVNYFEIQSNPDALLQWTKERIVPKTPSTSAFDSRTPRMNKKKDNKNDWDLREKDNTIITEINCDNKYAVFISYVEIYNNYVYDLLDDSMDSRHPISKLLREDHRHRVFVNKGIELEVKSADQAFEIFIKGVQRRRIAQTNLNIYSSRSHSVFTIRLVQAPIDSNGEVIQDQNYLIASQLSIVDLAGSERTDRTQNTGIRLKEGSNINNSLMNLRNCIDILRENQLNGGNRVVPYRDNKLTHLFKSYFEGEGKVKMIICVNPCAADYDETQHVMKFAEKTQEVLVSKGFNDIRDNLSNLYENMGGVDLAVNTLVPHFPKLLLEDPEDDKVFPEWLHSLETRKHNKETEFEKLNETELSVRQRVSEAEHENLYYRQQMCVMQMDLEARKHQVKDLEYKCYQTEKKCERDVNTISEYESNIKTLESSLEEKNRQITDSKLEKERLKSEMRKELNSERNKMKAMFEKLLAEKESQLEREQCVSKDKINLVKQILNADNTNWELLGENDDMFNRVSCVALNGIESGTVLKRKCEYDSNTPQTVDRRESVTTHNAPPAVNPRHRRSLSTCSEKWIDHRPYGTLDLGTVMKPKIKNKKSVSNLKVKDIKEASNYAVTHHEADNRGQVETQVYKGEVIPSISGGTQVIFNDIETLKQKSPSLKFL